MSRVGRQRTKAAFTEVVAEADTKAGTQATVAAGSSLAAAVVPAAEVAYPVGMFSPDMGTIPFCMYGMSACIYIPNCSGDDGMEREGGAVGDGDFVGCGLGGEDGGAMFYSWNGGSASSDAWPALQLAAPLQGPVSMEPMLPGEWGSCGVGIGTQAAAAAEISGPEEVSSFLGIKHSLSERWRAVEASMHLSAAPRLVELKTFLHVEDKDTDCKEVLRSRSDGDLLALQRASS